MPFIAIDIGGSSIKAALVRPLAAGLELSGKTRVEGVIGDIKTLSETIYGIIKSFRDSGLEISGIGISSFGSIGKDGAVLRASRVDGYQGFVWADAINKEFSSRYAVTVCNDGQSAAYGVMTCDPVAKGAASLAHFVVGSGVGGGAVIDGALWRGANGLAGHFGHTKMPGVLPRECRCSYEGCIETVASADALMADAHALLGTPVSIADLAARTDEPQVRQLVEAAGMALGVGIGNIINTIDPGLVTLGGGVVEAFGSVEDNIYVAAALRSAERNSIIRGWENTRIAITALGNDAALYGAALLAVGKTS